MIGNLTIHRAERSRLHERASKPTGMTGTPARIAAMTHPGCTDIRGPFGPSGVKATWPPSFSTRTASCSARHNA